MYIPEELQKENRFIDVAIPSNKSFFSRLGEVTASAGLYSGDERVNPYQDKIDQIEDYQKYIDFEIAKEQSKSD